MPRPPTTPISRTKWAILFSEQGGCCAGCFKPLGEDVHVDHVHPLACGGEDRFENLQLLHAACNLEKGDMPAATWFARQRRRLMLEVAAIRRRQILITIDPELAGWLRAAAKRSRVPISRLMEQSLRQIFGLRPRDTTPVSRSTFARASDPFAAPRGDLFGNTS